VKAFATSPALVLACPAFAVDPVELANPTLDTAHPRIHYFAEDEGQTGALGVLMGIGLFSTPGCVGTEPERWRSSSATN
jgi:hypothetical protein